MATKAKTKSKALKKPAGRVPAVAKSLRLKRKAVKTASSNLSRNGSKTAKKARISRSKVQARRISTVGPAPSARPAPPERVRSKHLDSAIQAYEAGIKLMHTDEFEKAIRHFEDLIATHPEEPEIQERAKVLLQACETKIQNRGKKQLRSADDYYNLGITELNRRELNSALEHLQHALKLLPKGDYILFALATASALDGNRALALHYLKESIGLRGENRFLAARDSDFESLHDDPEFRQLVTPSEK